MKTNIVIDISTPIPYLELRAKMLSTSQITGFFKMYYLKIEGKYEIHFWNAD